MPTQPSPYNPKDRAETQMIEYGTRMRKERDAARDELAKVRAQLNILSEHYVNCPVINRDQHDPIRVARCLEHGLHGDRHECFVCGGPVERVEMVEVPA